MGIGRRVRATRIWYSSLSTWKRLLALLVLMMSPCLFCCGGGLLRGQYIHWFVLTKEDHDFREASRTRRHKYEEGVPSAARKLIVELEPFQDPDEAVAAHPDWFQHRFENGEWVFGYGIDSHGFRVGHGTLVIKDSRGRTRVYFGHVCGRNAGLPWGIEYYKGLDGFCKWFEERFDEWFP